MPTTAVPILRVADAEAVLGWWERLGFSEEFRHTFGPGMPLFVGLQREGTRISLSEHTGDAPGPALVHLWVDDVEAVAARFDVPLNHEEWATDCELVDPDGNRIRVATAPDA